MPTKPDAPFFKATGNLPRNPATAYVAWLDVMGVQASMLRSLPVCANFIFKLHIAALEESTPAVSLYPVMDGVYVVTPDRDVMRQFLSDVMTRLARGFNNDANEHRFLVKSAVAHGPVIHGRDVNAAASAVFQKPANAAYKDSLLLGMPVVLSHKAERLAAPFGIRVDQSAGDFLTADERKKSHVWWPWFPAGQNQEAQALKANLPDYFSWCTERAGALDYDIARIKVHEAQASQYFVDA